MIFKLFLFIFVSQMEFFFFQLSFVGSNELAVREAASLTHGSILLNRSHGQQNQTLSVPGILLEIV